MALRLNKTSKILFALGIVILSGALGYLIWRVNEKETVAPGESKAGENQCCCPEDIGHPERGCTSSVACICEFAEGNCDDLPLCTPEYNCYEGSDCNDQVSCSWPSVAFCNYGKCECRSSNNGCTSSNHCTPSCDGELYDPPCKSGESVSCSDECSGCNNAYTYNSCCRKEEVEVVCGDGKKDSTEACDYKASPTGCKSGYTCTNKCKCVATASCGDGKVDTGEDCDPKAIPTGCNTGATCLSDCSCSAVTEDTCGDGTLDTGEECEVGDPTGNSCTWVNCNQSTCLCKALSITKGVVERCIDEGTENPKAELTYTVTVANSGTEDRTVTKIEDVLDPKILSAGITPTGITSPGAYSNGKILWDYQTTNLAIKGGETKIYTYKLSVDKANFGEYTNTVTLTRSTGVTSEASSKIVADCVIEIPQTGIFDSTLGRIAVGIALLIIGGVVYTIPSRVLILQKKENPYKYRGRFEKRITK